MAQTLLPIEDAKTRLLNNAIPVSEKENLILCEANGRVLSTPLRAKITQPPFDASAMDGYAVRSDDLQNTGIILDLIGESAAGNMPQTLVRPGTAMRIFTGAPIPDGADAVVIQEETEWQKETESAQHNRILFKSIAKKGANIRNCGKDFSEGYHLLDKGFLLDERSVSLAAAAGFGSLDVFRRPRVAVLSTGNELVPAGMLPGPGQISASGGIAVQILAKSNGADIIDLGIASDEKSTIRLAVESAIEKHADILVTIGGASVGDHDLIRPTLLEMGMELDFWKIAMRPGKPLMVGRLGNMSVLGLPGNPVSSFVCALLFAEPLIRKVAHLPNRVREAKAFSIAHLKENGSRQHYMRARFTDETQKSVVAYENQDSSLMESLAKSDCLIIRTPYAAPTTPGTEVPILKLRSSDF